MTEDAGELLELLVAHEKAIGELYLSYAAAFAGFSDLWQALAGEERRHAGRLAGLRGDPALAEWLTPEVRRRSAALRSSIGYLKAQAVRAGQAGFTSVQALAVAKDVEDALIDRLGFLPAAPQWTEIGRVVSELQEETDAHRRMISEALEAAKSPGR